MRTVQHRRRVPIWIHSRHTGVSARLCLLLAIVLTIAPYQLNAAVPTAESPMITVKLSRGTGGAPLDDYPLELSVNGNVLGTVDPARDVTFKVIPVDSGTYEFSARLKNYVGGLVGPPSRKVTLSVPAGATVSVNCVSNSFSELPIHVILVGSDRHVAMRILSAHLTDRYVERELSRETVNTPRGAKRTIRRSRTFEHGISISATSDLEGALKTDLS